MRPTLCHRMLFPFPTYCSRLLSSAKSAEPVSLMTFMECWLFLLIVLPQVNPPQKLVRMITIVCKAYESLEGF